MLFIPNYLKLDGPGIPPMNFYLTAFLPLILHKNVLQAMTRDRHWLDYFVYLFILTIGLSEFTTTGFESARQTTFLNCLVYLGPYMATKHIITNEKKEISLAKIFVSCLALIAIYNVYTFRMGFNHFLWLRDFWPYFYERSNIIVIPRWGFFRAQGPFVHPIAAGIIFGFAMPTTFWLVWHRQIKPMWKGIAIWALCILGLFMTMSRGPFLGAFIAVTIYLMGQSRYRLTLFTICGVAIFFLSMPLSVKINDYLSVTRATAKTAEQETAIYRKDLITNYTTVIKEKPLLGYGFMNLPQVGDQVSIDNAYILYALNWGIICVLAVIGLIFGSILGLFKLAFSKDLNQMNRGVAWSLIGGIAGCSLSMGTVHLARPASTILFMWAAWSAALLLRNDRGLYKTEDQQIPETGGVETQESKMIIL